MLAYVSNQQDIHRYDYQIHSSERAGGWAAAIEPCIATDSDDEKGGNKKVKRSDQL